MTDHLRWFARRKVIVTGGLGFIGSHVAEALVDAGASVSIVDSSTPGLGANPFNVAEFAHRVTLSDVDLRNRKALVPLVADAECVFNLAGQVSHIDSMTAPEFDFEINAWAQLQLLEAVRAAGNRPRVVFASTRQVYGRPSHLPVDEDHPPNPLDVNGVNKLAGEQYHRVYGAVHDLPVVLLRLTNTYGPRQLMKHGRQGFIPVFIRAALEGRTISLYGGGHQIREANHVTDVVDAFLRAGALAEAVAGRTYNLGAKPSFSLRQFAALVLEAAGTGSIEDIPWPAERTLIDIGDYESDHRRAERELGWTPSCPLADGLAATMAFYRDHGVHYW